MADEYPEIFVLRHGQTEWNLEGRYQGRMNSELTEKGRAQAALQGLLLAKATKGRSDISAYCSPQKRAVHTAQIALGPIGMSAVQDERLCEISFGAWEGLTFEQITTGWPEQMKHAEQDDLDWQFSAPGGESLEIMKMRIQSFLSSLQAPSIIITHGITSRLLRGLWLGKVDESLGDLMGGQGCVYHLRDGQQVRLTG